MYSIALRPAPLPGETTPEHGAVRPPAPPATAGEAPGEDVWSAVAARTIAPNAETARPITTPGAAGAADPAARRLAAEDATAPRHAGEGFAGPMDPDRDDRRPRPAPPLRSFAQIPTEVMEEISRLREQAATQAQGVPGRADPTPVPGPVEAIGPASSPLDRPDGAIVRKGGTGEGLAQSTA